MNRSSNKFILNVLCMLVVCKRKKERKKKNSISLNNECVVE